MQNNYCKSTPAEVYEAEKLRPEDKCGSSTPGVDRATVTLEDDECPRSTQTSGDNHSAVSKRGQQVPGSSWTA